jgi:putative transcriptional regulator
MIRIHLSRLLGDRKWTQKDLAVKTGIRPSTIGDYYHELADRINLEYLDLICEALDCKASDLIEYIPNKIKRTGKNLIK